MLIDAETLRDLEIFQAREGTTCLFDMLDCTRTRSGREALRARFRNPNSDAERICSIHAAIHFIHGRWAELPLLPGEADLVELGRYLRSNMITASARHRAGLAIESLWTRLRYRDLYNEALRGVRLAARFVRATAEFAQAPQLDNVPAELDQYVRELRSLVSNEHIRAALRHNGRLPWRILQQDRLLRLQLSNTLERMMQLIAEIDALVALAEVTRQKGFVLPEVVSAGSRRLEAQGLFHPFLSSPVANDLAFDDAQNFVFLTGPNMAGKTTYLRACGVTLYLAHLGMGVPAARMRFAPFDVLLSAIDLSDNLRAGVSFFRAEALRVKTLAVALADGRRVFAILDEPFKGTNVRDALDASRAVFQLLAHSRSSVFLVASHLIELADALAVLPSVLSRRFEADESGSDLVYDYVARPGVSGQRLGMRVLEQERVFELLHHSASLGVAPAS